MNLLGVRCKSCGRTFGTGFVLGSAGLPRLGEFERRCPTCAAVASYHGEDLTPMGA